MQMSLTHMSMKYNTVSETFKNLAKNLAVFGLFSANIYT